MKIASFEEYEKKARMHKLHVTLVTAVIIAVVLSLVGFAAVYIYNRIYERYVVVGEEKEYSTGEVTLLAFGTDFLTYNTDGIHCVNASGTDLWTGTYEMQSPMVEVNGNYVVVADRGGREIFIYDKKGLCGKIKTGSPVIDVSVSGGGIVAASVDEGDSISIYVYDYTLDKDDKCVSKVYSTMEGSGYPVAFSCSPGGNLMAVSYMSASGGTLNSSVAFYNFGEVGKNTRNNLMRSYSYMNESVPMIRFMDDKTAFAVSGSRLVIYSDDAGQDPESINEILINREIRSVYYDSNHIGIVFSTESVENKYSMDIYDKKGNVVSTILFNTDYENIYFLGNRVVIVDSGECFIYKVDGRKKAELEFADDEIRLMLPTKRYMEFTQVTGAGIRRIRLK
ncbi:MAG: DUF5711 family protein [Lachnospiraceae bacterium]|nr:DUF5711 family protein [Lachnospiraceae bacterium]